MAQVCSPASCGVLSVNLVVFNCESWKNVLSELRGHSPTNGGSDDHKSSCGYDASFPLSRLVLCVPVG